MFDKKEIVKDEGFVMFAYVSHIRLADKNDRDKIDQITAEIHAHAKNNNKKIGLTGVLYYGNHLFFQYIEGTELEVFKMKRLIELDPRHSNFTMVDSANISKRKFKSWSMKFVSDRYYIDSLLDQISLYCFENGRLNENNGILLKNLLKLL